MESRIKEMLMNLGWLNQDIVLAHEKDWLRVANRSYCKRLWPSFTEKEIDSALDIFYGKGEYHDVK